MALDSLGLHVDFVIGGYFHLGCLDMSGVCPQLNGIWLLFRQTLAFKVCFHFFWNLKKILDLTLGVLLDLWLIFGIVKPRGGTKSQARGTIAKDNGIRSKRSLETTKTTRTPS